ncbi:MULTISPECIES: hypothetical protein [Streptomyces]|uniref:hypothetical protein n=1 Tax=Streptomyces TaxID=1883 RepID=UPI000AAFF477|nr:hypothetical protein [Streptomyces durhamensis]
MTSRYLRGMVAGGHVEVHEELYDGSTYADRHTCFLTKTDGTTVTMEVYVFADLAPDGRCHRIDDSRAALAQLPSA